MEAGVAGFRYRGEDHIVRSGDVFLLNPDEVHTGRPISPGGYLYRVVYLDAVALSPLLADTWDINGTSLSFRQTVVRESVLAATLRQLHRAIARPEPSMQAEHLVLRLSQVLPWRRRGLSGLSVSDTRDPGCARVVRTAKEYLEAHPADKVTLRDLASAAQTSPYRLSRMFSAQVGMPPHAYQTQLRVRLARRLLAEGLAAVEVAVRSGFYDQAHLSRVFKSYTGVSPTQFSRDPRQRPAAVPLADCLPSAMAGACP